jgi:glycosyltransferase involved in cell wall biosynthesis
MRWSVPSLVVVVPCFNEGRRLDPVAFHEFIADAREAEILFVNDGSTDDTLDVLESLCEFDNRRLRVLNLPNNVGKADAVRQGLLAACQRGAELVAYWDADLATPLSAVPQFQDVFLRRKAIDIVAGIRLPLLGHAIERKVVRRWLGRGFAWCAATALELPLRDTQCGAKMFRAGDALQASLAEPFQSRWIFDVELLVRWRLFLRRTRGASLRERTYEFPLEQWTDVPGSHLRPRDFVRAVGELAAIYGRYVLGRYEPNAWKQSPATLPLPILAETERRAA